MSNHTTEEETEQLPPLTVRIDGTQVIIRGNGPMSVETKNYLRTDIQGRLATDGVLEQVVEELNEIGFREYVTSDSGSGPTIHEGPKSDYRTVNLEER